MGGREPAKNLRLADQFVQGKDITRIAPALMADLEQLAGLAHRFHHGAGALDGVAHHFFAIDMQPGLQTGIGHGRVPEIRNSHDHGLQIFFIGKQFLVIVITLHVKSVILQPTDIAVAIIIPDIHHGDEANAGNHLK